MENATYANNVAWSNPNDNLSSAAGSGGGSGGGEVVGGDVGILGGFGAALTGGLAPDSYNLENDDFGGFNNTSSAISPSTSGEPITSDDWSTWYIHNVHGWLSLAVCVFGILANILNVVVLSRKNMISPTNAILIGLAVADMLVMCFYLPYTLLEFVQQKDNDCILDDVPVACRSYAAIVYTLVYSNATVVFHTVSTWLTVALAVWRWMAVTFPSQTRNVCSMRRAQIAIGSTYLATAIACIPNYITFTVHEVIAKSRIHGQPVVSYKVDFTVVRHFESIRKFNFWMYSVLMKLVPCIALTVLSTALVRALCEADERRRRLKARPNSQAGAVSGTTPAEQPSANQRSSDRTTRMLLAVLLLFLITEFPAGILSLLSGILGDSFFERYYLRVGDILDILALINSSVNFILYCSMSRQFRKTFALLFTPRWLQHWAPVMATEANATIATTCV